VWRRREEKETAMRHVPKGDERFLPWEGPAWEKSIHNEMQQLARAAKVVGFDSLAAKFEESNATIRLTIWPVVDPATSVVAGLFISLTSA
jgi:hypothetical protein